MSVTIKNFDDAKQAVIDYYGSLSSREKTIIIVAGAVATLMALYSIFEPVRDAFENQAKRIKAVEQAAATAPIMLGRYARLASQKDTIESEYKKVELKQGGLSHIATLIKTKAGVESGYKITPGRAIAFGGDFNQEPFKIEFKTDNLAKLVDFLKELVDGDSPLFLSRMDLRTSRARTEIEVELNVSAISRTTS